MPIKTAAPKTAKPKAGTAKSASAAEANASVKSIAKAAPKALPADQGADAVVEGAKVVVSMRVKDLIERVSAAGEFKKKDVREIVEATLVELGKALEAGESLNLPPFGKMHIRNTRAIDNGVSAMTLKLRRSPAKAADAKAGKEALAEAPEAG